MADTPFGFTEGIKVRMAPGIEDGEWITRTFDMGFPVHERPAEEHNQSFMVVCSFLPMSMEG